MLHDASFHANKLSQRLGLAVSAPRIARLTLPIYLWCRAQLLHQRAAAAAAAAAAAHAKPVVALGLSAPQGCGKTTLTNLLIERFADDNLRCAVLSIDDFYLTGADQDALAAANPSNPLLQVRGNAGTHDVALGVATLEALLRGERGVRLPRYDKSARGGRGDRLPLSEWPTLEEPPDVVLLEGWMLGFSPVAECADVEITEINRLLAAYDAWHRLMSGWVVVAADDIANVYRWRLEAEHAMAAEGRPGMDDAAVEDFVNRYMPAYRTYMPSLHAAAASGGVNGLPTLLVPVGRDRLPTRMIEYATEAELACTCI